MCVCVCIRVCVSICVICDAFWCCWICCCSLELVTPELVLLLVIPCSLLQAHVCVLVQTNLSCSEHVRLVNDVTTS